MYTSKATLWAFMSEGERIQANYNICKILRIYSLTGINILFLHFLIFTEHRLNIRLLKAKYTVMATADLTEDTVSAVMSFPYTGHLIFFS